jgi:hypothetical protein
MELKKYWKYADLNASERNNHIRGLQILKAISITILTNYNMTKSENKTNDVQLSQNVML